MKSLMLDRVPLVGVSLHQRVRHGVRDVLLKQALPHNGGKRDRWAAPAARAFLPWVARFVSRKNFTDRFGDGVVSVHHVTASRFSLSAYILASEVSKVSIARHPGG